MAECALSFVGETIGNLFIDEVKFLSGVEDKVKDLQNKLAQIWRLLRNMDERRQHDQAGELQDIAYAAEDVIDQYIFRVTLKKDENIIKEYADFMSKCVCVRVHAMAKEIDQLKSRISVVRTEMKEHSKKSAKASRPVPSYGHFTEEFLGRTDDINKLVEGLLNKEKKHRVISIWGMDGLGKTALAKEVFNHDEVRKYFEGFAWVCVSRKCREMNILKEIHGQLIPGSKKEVNTMGEQELSKNIFTTQKMKKCIVVLDDIWTKKAWEKLRQAFPLNDMASKLLITTHSIEVAQKIYLQGSPHQLQCLSENESWELLKTKAFLTTEEITEYMKNVEGELLKKCGGLPLAIIVLGELLVVKRQGMIDRKINSHFSNKISEMLALSYDDLPWHLNQCFLYLCSFPTNEEMPAAKVFFMWIAEGFVLPSADQEEGFTLEDEAEQYLMEFVNRGLVQVRFTLSGKIKTCRLRDPVQNLCISKVTKQILLRILNIQHGDKVESSYPTRRLSLHMRRSAEGNTIPELNQIGNNLRTLMFFHYGGFVDGTWQQFQHFFINCKFLRVLKLVGLSSMKGNLPESMGDLFYLRYLSLAGSAVEGLPQSMGNLVYMEFLDLPLCDVKVTPYMLWKMRRLRYLHLPISFTVHGSKKLRLDSLMHLQTLRNFCPEKCDVNDVGKQTNLRKLTICKQYGSDKFKIFPQLVKFTLKCLQSSSFRFESSSFSENELSKMSKYPHSCKLSIGGKIEKLPELKYLPKKLRKLVLMNCQLEEDPMPILGELQDLVVLLLSCAFVGKRMVARGFPQLKHLLLYKLPNLEEWTINQGALPNLSRLGIRDCPRLKTAGNNTYDDFEDIDQELSKYRD